MGRVFLLAEPGSSRVDGLVVLVGKIPILRMHSKRGVGCATRILWQCAVLPQVWRRTRHLVPIRDSSARGLTALGGALRAHECSASGEWDVQQEYCGRARSHSRCGDGLATLFPLVMSVPVDSRHWVVRSERSCPGRHWEGRSLTWGNRWQKLCPRYDRGLSVLHCVLG
jgi:hypothetical protein